MGPKSKSNPSYESFDSKHRVNLPVTTEIGQEVLQGGVEEASRRIGTNLREFDKNIGNKSAATKMANKRLQMMELAAVLLDLRTKSGKLYASNRC